MAMEVIAWLIALPLLGTVTGLRTFTPLTVLCWFAWTRALPLDDTWAFWAAKLPVAILFTVLAVCELVADKQPWIPDRTRPFSVATKLVLGGLLGAIVATGLNGAAIEGIILSVLGVLVGTYGGFLIRRDLVQKTNCQDWQVAVTEDAVAVVCAVVAMAVVSS